MVASIDQNLALSKLLDLDSFREVCRSFSDLYGIGMRVFDAEGVKLVDVRVATGDHCGYLFSIHSTKVECSKLVNKIRSFDQEAREEPYEFNCFSGLRYKVMPILYEGDVFGRVIFGPYAPSELQEPPADLKKYKNDGLKLEVLGQYLDDIPRASEQAVEKVLDHIRKVLDVIIHTSYKSYLTSQMHIASITGAFEDLERTNAELKDANQSLRDLDRLKSNFIATVSHELRTPLTSIIGYSEMLIEGMAGDINDEQRRYVSTILEKGESLLGLIGQVLELSRIESGNVRVQKEDIQPDRLAKLSISDVHPQAMKRNLNLNLNVGDGVRTIHADPDKIRRVMTNLLGNAVKFTTEGGSIDLILEVTEAPPPGSDRFDVFQPERNEYLRIAVTDSGIGIPADKLERVFDSFFQVDGSSTREFGGTGLGLSIVQNFVKAHGGRCSVESEVGKGSTFSVLLPYHTEIPKTAAGVDGLGDLSPGLSSVG